MQRTSAMDKHQLTASTGLPIWSSSRVRNR